MGRKLDGGKLERWKAQKIASQTKRRSFHRLIGICPDCRAKAAPGRKRCLRHLTYHNAANNGYRMTKKKARGWIYMRVAV